MLVQAAKIIGSGLATIGLSKILYSIVDNDYLLISKIIYTKFIRRAIFRVDSMINNLPKKVFF